jgi:hypothetical protein
LRVSSPPARSTVAAAIKALEDARVLSWVQRIKQVRERCPHLLGDDGWRWRVLRTSNAYNFCDPGAPSSQDEPSKANFQSGTPKPSLFFFLGVAFGDERTGRSGRKEFEGKGDEFRSPTASFEDRALPTVR